MQKRLLRVGSLIGGVGLVGFVAMSSLSSCARHEEAPPRPRALRAAIVSLRVSPVTASGEPWDPGSGQERLPDPALCIRADHGTKRTCFPGGSEALAGAGCTDAVSCVFSNAMTPATGSFEVEVWDDDTAAAGGSKSEIICKGTCSFGETCTFPASTKPPQAPCVVAVADHPTDLSAATFQ